ncbi:MAG: 6,7-dimethyl-8-ribityllumazine synthase [Cytophagales bacterium]|nr:6,7-dimethyl-8-ribityllumazine synthase [Cytophagales bacterium]
MSTLLQKIGDFVLKRTSKIRDKRIDIIVTEWNHKITEALYKEAWATLIQNGAKKKNITRVNVPGSYELSLAAQWSAQQEDVAAIICLGCVIQGHTRHFEFICQAVAQGLTQVALKYNKPVIFGVLTTDNWKQAEERADGSVGNKGKEAALAAIKMLELR